MLFSTKYKPDLTVDTKRHPIPTLSRCVRVNNSWLLLFSFVENY